MYAERDSDRVASVARVVSHPGMLVLSSSAVDEFATPLNELRAVNLLLVLLVGFGAAIAFWVLSRRVTQPLAALTEAADEIGAGHFTPVLPPRTQDDVGRLIGAFGAMTLHVRQMMDELEASRQMAAVGAFAGQISHEIRNPLTAIKLNLQSLQRDARTGLFPTKVRAPSRSVSRRFSVSIAWSEACFGLAGHVTRAARDIGCRGNRVRSAARASATGRTWNHDQRDASASADAVLADPEQLSGVFLNVFVNAIEALQSTGRIDRGSDGNRRGAGASNGTRRRLRTPDRASRPSFMLASSIRSFPRRHRARVSASRSRHAMSRNTVDASCSASLPTAQVVARSSRTCPRSWRGRRMSGKRILVVDDDAAIRETLARTLSRSGYEVIVSASAEDALSRIQRSTRRSSSRTCACAGWTGSSCSRLITRRIPIFTLS